MSNGFTTKSPIKEKPLPQAGGSGQEHLTLGMIDLGFCFVLGACFIPVVLLDWLRYWLSSPPTPWLDTLVAFVLALIAFRLGRHKWRQLDQLALGIKGERAVADALDQLRERGYRIFHDIHERDYNIDHAIIGPGGIFAIETKTHRKAKGATVVVDGDRITVGGFVPDRDPVVQAKAAARRIHDVLKQQTGRDVWVKPVVLYPGWFVTHKSKPTADLFVGSETFFLGSFDYQHSEERISPEDVDALARGMEQHLKR